MGVFKIDGIQYNIENEENLNITINQIRNSQSHIKAQGEIDSSLGRVVGDVGDNIAGLANSLGRGFWNFAVGTGAKAGASAVSALAGESIPEIVGSGQRAEHSVSMDAPREASQYYDQKIGDVFEWMKTQTGRQAERMVSQPYAALPGAGALMDRILRDDKDVPDNNTARSIGEGVFDVGMAAGIVGPAARIPSQMRAAKALEMRKVADAARQKMAEEMQQKAVQDAAIENIGLEGAVGAVNNLRGDLATAAIDRQQVRGPQFNARDYAKDGEHYAGRNPEMLAERQTPHEIRTLNDEFQGANAGALRIQELSPEATGRELKQAGKELGPRLAEDAPKVEGIDYNTTDVRPSLIEALERATNKSTAIRNTLNEVRNLWDQVEKEMKTVGDWRTAITDEKVLTEGLGERPAGALRQHLADISKIADQLQVKYGEYLSKYDQRKLQFYKEKSELYSREMATRGGPPERAYSPLGTPDGIVKTERPLLGKPSGARGRQRGVIDPDLLTLGIPALIRKLGSVGALEKFKGTFGPQWQQRLKDAAKFQSGNERVVWMSPQDFKKFAMERSEAYLNAVSPEKRNTISKVLETKEEGLLDGPTLTIDSRMNGSTRVTSHEGRHRMDEFERRGMNQIPVLVLHDRLKGTNLDRAWPSKASPEYTTSDAAGNPIYPDRPFPEPILNRQLTSDTPRGRQSGAINFGGKPSLKKFKEDYKRMGLNYPDSVIEAVYKDKYGPKEGPQVEASVKGVAEQVSESITGVQDYRMELKPIDEMIKDLQGRPDIDVGPFKGYEKQNAWRTWKETIHNLQASLSDTARTTNNPTLRAVYTVMEKTKRDISNHIDMWLRDSERGIIPKAAALLKDKVEVAKFWEEVVQKEEGKRWVPSEELRQRGYSEPVIIFYETLQNTFKDILNKVNEVRVERGLSPVRERPGYFPGQFAGRFQVNAWIAGDAGQVLVGRFGANKRGNIQGAIDQLKREHPDWEFGKIEQRTRARGEKMGDVDAAQLIFEDMMGRFENADPRVTAARELIQEVIAQNVARTANAHQHFKDKKGIYGTAGFDPTRSMLDNFKDGIKGATFYAEQMANWTEVNRHDRYVRDLTDPTKIPGQENAQAYAKYHWDTAMRKDIGNLGKSINAVTDNMVNVIYEHLGIPHDFMTSGARAVKSAIMINFFGGYNPRFIGTQLVQPLQSILPTFSELAIKGVGSHGHIAPALLKGFWDSTVVFGGKIIGKVPKELHELVTWAETHDVVKPHFIEEMRAFHKDLVNNRVADWIDGAWMIRASEQVARTQFFLSVYHYLKESGLKGEALLETSANLTNIKMVDYRPQSKAMAFQRLGALGDILSPLATFKVNYISQMTSMFFEATRQGWNPKYYVPFGLMLLGTQLFSGLVGMPGREDYDRLISILEKKGVLPPYSKAKIEDYIYNPKNNTDFYSRGVNFGGVSAITGQDISLSFSAPSPTNPENFTVIPGKIMDVAKGAAQSIGERSPLPFLNQVVPQGGPYRWALEQANTKPNGDVVDIKDPQRAIKAHRTTQEQAMRLLGTRSIPESITSHRTFLKQQHEVAKAEQYKSARNTAIRKIREGEPFPAQEIDKLLALGANREAIKNIYETAEKKNWTPSEQVLNRRSRSQKFIEQQKFLRGE